MTARVMLVGPFGAGHAAADARLDACIRSLPGHQVVATSIDMDETAARGAEPVRHSLRDVQRSLARVDALVVVGATLFEQRWPRRGHGPGPQACTLAASARARGVPVALVGVGTDPLCGSFARRAARALVRSATLTTLRDEESACLLGDAGVPGPFRIASDPAWVAIDPDPATRAADPTSLRTGGGDDEIVVTPPPTLRSAWSPARLAEALRPLAADGARIVIQPWARTARPRSGVGPGATALARALGRAARLEEPARDLATASRRLRGARLVVSSDVVALVAAAGAGTASLALVDGPAPAGLARRLGQPSTPVHAPAAVLARCLRLALEGPPAHLDLVDGERRAAHEQFRLLRVVLAQGSTVEVADLQALPLSDGAGTW